MLNYSIPSIVTYSSNFTKLATLTPTVSDGTRGVVYDIATTNDTAYIGINYTRTSAVASAEALKDDLADGLSKYFEETLTNNIKKNIKQYELYGFTKSQIIKITTTIPELLEYSNETINEKLLVLEKLGFNKEQIINMKKKIEYLNVRLRQRDFVLLMKCSILYKLEVKKGEVEVGFVNCVISMI